MNLATTNVICVREPSIRLRDLYVCVHLARQKKTSSQTAIIEAEAHPRSTTIWSGQKNLEVALCSDQRRNENARAKNCSHALNENGHTDIRRAMPYEVKEKYSKTEIIEKIISLYTQWNLRTEHMLKYL